MRKALPIPTTPVTHQQATHHRCGWKHFPGLGKLSWPKNWNPNKIKETDRDPDGQRLASPRIRVHSVIASPEGVLLVPGMPRAGTRWLRFDRKCFRSVDGWMWNLIARLIVWLIERLTAQMTARITARLTARLTLRLLAVPVWQGNEVFILVGIEIWLSVRYGCHWDISVSKSTNGKKRRVKTWGCHPDRVPHHQHREYC